MTKHELRAITTGALELAIFYREKSLAIDIHEDYDSWKFYSELASEYDRIYLNERKRHTMTKQELRAITTGALELAIFYREKSLAIDFNEYYDSWKFYSELASEYDSIYLKYQDKLDELNKKDEFFNA